MAVSGPNSASMGSSGTNLDVGGIVSKLKAVEQKPLVALNAKKPVSNPKFLPSVR